MLSITALASIIAFPALRNRQAPMPPPIMPMLPGLPPMQIELAPMPATGFGTDDTDAVTDFATDATPAKSTVTLLPREAARLFLESWLEAAGAGEILWRHVWRSYEKERAIHGWPPIKEKALSQMLVKMGCERKVLDLRKEKKGRPTAFVFPEEIQEAA